MAPQFSTLAWKIPWTEGPGGLQSMGSLGVPPSIRVFSNESTLRIRYKEQGDRAEKLSPPSWKRFECALLQNVSLCFPKGIILSAIVSTDPQKSPFLLVLDARTFTELARA